VKYICPFPSPHLSLIPGGPIAQGPDLLQCPTAAPVPKGALALQGSSYSALGPAWRTASGTPSAYFWKFSWKSPASLRAWRS
jgi:hypothetical protein